MYLLGLSGKMGSGKDEVFSIVKSHFPTKDVRRLGFADSLKLEVSKAVGKPLEYIESNKKHFRLILQGYGTDYRRQLCGDDYWLIQFMLELRKLPDNCFVIVPDVRFENEYELIKGLGGELWRIERTGEPSQHISEQDLDHHTFDHYIYNTGTLSWLKGEVEKALKVRNFIN
jgi:hypothetical protein